MLLFVYAIFLFQATLGFPTTPESSSPLNDLATIFPLKELQELKLLYLNNDQNFQAAVAYLKSPEWKAIVNDVRVTPEWIEYKNFIKVAGIDLDFYIRHLEHCVNATDTSKFHIRGVKPSLGKFIQQVKMTLGVQLLKGLQGYVGKMKNVDQHLLLKERMTSPKSKELFEKTLKQPPVQKFVNKLEEMDIDIKYILQMIYLLAGWDSSAIEKDGH